MNRLSIIQSKSMLENYEKIIKNKFNTSIKYGIDKSIKKFTSKIFDILEQDYTTENKKTSIINSVSINEKINAKKIKEPENKKELNNKGINKIKKKFNFKEVVIKVIDINKYLTNFKKEEKNKNRNYIINPENRIDNIFQIIIMILILYSVTVLPFKLAFYGDSVIFFFDFMEYLLEVFFVIDFIKNFFTAYYDEQKNLVFDRRKISLNYLKGWFIFDLISSIPFKLMTYNSNLLIIKFSKLPKFVKFIKLAKILRIFKYIKDKKKFDGLLSKFTNIKNGYERMFGSFIMAIVIFHSISCFWFIIGFIHDKNQQSWVISRNIHLLSVQEQYLISLYWTIQTVFTVGYGDYGPVNSTERFVATLIMFVGVFIYSFVIGNLSNIFNIISNQDQFISKNNQILTSIMKKYKHIKNNHLINKIKKFLKNVCLIDQSIDEFINELPDNIKKEIIIEITKNKVKGINYFDNKYDDFLFELGDNLKFLKYKKFENIYEKDDLATKIYFIKEGCVDFYYKEDDKKEKILTIKKGFYFGELDIFYYDSLRLFDAEASEDTILLSLKFEILDNAFFKRFIDCGEEMINDSKDRKLRIENKIISMGFNFKSNNQDKSKSQLTDTYTSNSSASNKSIKYSNNYYNDSQINFSIKNKNKKRGSEFFNNFNKLIKNTTIFDKKKNNYENINKNNNIDFLKNVLFDKKNKKYKEMNEITNKIEKLTIKYEEIADKYSFLSSNNYKKYNDNKKSLKYKIINKYIEHEEEIEYSSKDNIINMQNTIKKLKNNKFK